MQGSVMDRGVGETTGFTAPCENGHPDATWVHVTQATVRWVNGRHLPLQPSDWNRSTYVDHCATCWAESMSRARALVEDERARQEEISRLQVEVFGTVLF